MAGYRARPIQHLALSAGSLKIAASSPIRAALAAGVFAVCGAALASCATLGMPRDWSARERRAAANVTSQSVLAHVRILADDLFEGRAPGSRGGELAMRYIASQMERSGLLPGAPDGTFFQRFDLIGMRSTPVGPFSARALGGERKSQTFTTRRDFVLSSGLQRAGAVAIDDAELVFVGYGITAPEEQWDDFKGADLRGKIALILNNDPEDDPKLFGGKTRLYYGRYTYKYEEAARRGARGAIILHTHSSAGYGWQVIETSFGDEDFELPARSGEPRLDVKAWMTERATAELVKLGGYDLHKLVARAQRRDFKPVPLGVTVSLALETALRKISTANVLGLLPGRARMRAREVVIYGAHHDHLGVRAAKNGDSIYNGAIDNATGVGALLAIAESMARMPERPARSVLFAALAAEESGLLGSEQYCKAPTFPAGRIAANLNIDGLNVWGKTRDVIFIGKGKSTLDEVLGVVARGQDRVVKAEESPDKGYFYRSDQFNFARVGVPGIYLERGSEFVGPRAATAKKLADSYEDKDYHQPSDEVRKDWVMDGALDDIRLLLVTGLRIAEAAALPAWRKGDEFEAARLRAIDAAKR